MTRLDWRKLPEIDPGRAQREGPRTALEVEAAIEKCNLAPRRITAVSTTPKGGRRLSFDEAVAKLPGFRRNLASRVRFIALAGKTDCNDLIHETALLVLKHAELTGDCSRALTLTKAVPSPSRKHALVKWFDMMGPIRVNIARDRVGLAKPEQRGFRSFDFDKARRVPFFRL